MQLAEVVRPAGYYRVKAKRLKSFIDWLFENYGGSLGKLEELGTEQLRAELLTVKGVGPETADSILLYAFGRTVFVVDAYTARIAGRHQLIEPGADYEQLRELFEANLPQEVQLFNEYHALLVRLGKEFCRPRAKCSGCPLEKLPHCLENE
jgi:endonuclease-3 related protein